MKAGSYKIGKVVPAKDQSLISAVHEAIETAIDATSTTPSSVCLTRSQVYQLKSEMSDVLDYMVDIRSFGSPTEEEVFGVKIEVVDDHHHPLLH